jgi:hypothetical protein
MFASIRLGDISPLPSAGSSRGSIIREATLDMSFFEIFAECSIALAGFGAVHAALRGSTGPRGNFRAWTVVANGALAFVLSILPPVLLFASIPEEVMWRSASALGVAGASAALYSVIRFDIGLARLGHPPQAPLNLRTGQLFPVISIVAMFGNIVGWPGPPGPFLYAAGVAFILIGGLNALLLSFFMTVELVLRGEDPDPPDDPTAA